MPKFTKQHYEIIAGILNAFVRQDAERQPSRQIPISALVEAMRFNFANDNPNFSSEKFLKACYHE